MQGACAVFYRHLWPVRLYHSFPNCLTKGAVLGEKNTISAHRKCFKYMVMSRDQNAGRIHSVRIDNSTFERVEEFKYL